MKSIINYFKEVKIELSQVVWPKRTEVIKLTMVVLIFTGIVGLFIGGVDFLFIKGLEYILAFK